MKESLILTSGVSVAGEDRRETCVKEERERVEAEIASLCTPCKMEFTACIELQAKGDAKRRKRGGVEEEEEEEEEESKHVCVELCWVDGDQSRDLLHQLMQFLQNKMASVDFQ